MRCGCELLFVVVRFVVLFFCWCLCMYVWFFGLEMCVLVCELLRDVVCCLCVRVCLKMWVVL